MASRRAPDGGARGFPHVVPARLRARRHQRPDCAPHHRAQGQPRQRVALAAPRRVAPRQPAVARGARRSRSGGTTRRLVGARRAGPGPRLSRVVAAARRHRGRGSLPGSRPRSAGRAHRPGPCARRPPPLCRGSRRLHTCRRGAAAAGSVSRTSPRRTGHGPARSGAGPAWPRRRTGAARIDRDARARSARHRAVAWPVRSRPRAHRSPHGAGRAQGAVAGAARCRARTSGPSGRSSGQLRRRARRHPTVAPLDTTHASDPASIQPP
jgi:hypothetical protein